MGYDNPVGSDSSHVESFIPCVRDVTANAGTHADRVVMQIIVVTDGISNVGVSVDDVGVESRAIVAASVRAALYRRLTTAVIVITLLKLPTILVCLHHNLTH